MNLKDKEIFISMEQLDDELLRGVVGGGPKSKGTKMTPDEDNGQENDLPGDNFTPKAGEHNITIEFNETLDDLTRIFEEVTYMINVKFNEFSDMHGEALYFAARYNPDDFASEDEYVETVLAEMQRHYSADEWKDKRQGFERTIRQNYSVERISLDELIEGALESVRQNYDEGLYPDIDWEELEERIRQDILQNYIH